ncbi:MAG: biopolymer transporter ExbD [Kiritimatiellae bacterium]|nr:biopolymer transporter ExbD [Kiritimatiellia bacterium]
MTAFFQRFAAAAPWLTLALLLAMFAFVHGRLALGSGVEVALPEAGTADAVAPASLVALALPAGDGSVLVFFDDARYSLGDAAGVQSFTRRLAERAAADESGRLALLADKRISAGDLMRLMDVARRCGVRHVQILEKGD